MTTSPLLIDLAQVDDLAAVGGKAFNLSRVRRLRLPTPDGVVVPDAVFQRHLARSGVLSNIETLFQGLDDLPTSRIETASAAIRERITITTLTAEFRDALSEVWEEQWPRRRLAVRSSAVGEDGAQTSFAGQLNSHLDIDDPAALETAIKATWSSLFSLRVLLYARYHKLRVRHMGVIVQPLVQARLSGVLFTRDPAGRRADAMLAEYCAGLGEQVVSGAVTPSRLSIHRRDLKVTVEHPGGARGALDGAATQAIRAIARMALQLEAEFGVPQDVEWCIDGNGQPVILQARPATRVAAPGITAKVHWSNANIAENFPEPVSPFLFSIVKPGYSAYFRNLGLGFGVSRRRLAAMAEPLDNIVGLQGGRLYYNLTNIHALLQMMPGGRRLVEFFNLFVGADAIPAPPSAGLGPLARVLEAVRISGSILWQYLFIQKRIRRFETRVDAFADATRPSGLIDKSRAALAADLEAFLTIRLTQWNDAALADTAAMVCYGLLKAQLGRALGDGDQTTLHNNLLKGLPGLVSAEPVTKLWALSQRIAGDAALNALFARESAAQILERLKQPDFEDFNQAFTDYLEHWGFRSSGELMLTTPTPQEDPRPVLRLLQTYVRTHSASPEELTRAQSLERQAATAQVVAQLSPRWWCSVPLLSRASRFRILLAATQGAISLRERARMKQALLYTRLRHVALAMGDRLQEAGLLERRDDVFLLTIHETRDLATNGAAGAAGLHATLEARRDAMANYQVHEPPDRLALAPAEQWQPSSRATRPGLNGEGAVHWLHGSGACGGSASGVAAVVLDVANADWVEAGQILVTRQTDPGWATVFFLVQGLVIERGGMLSHGAIIAREYGIPAVVGVPEATRLIRDGQQLRVDGDQGVVEVNGR